MGTAILHSHNCLQGRFRNDALAPTKSALRSRRNSYPSSSFSPNANPNPTSSAYQTRRRKRSPVVVHANYHDRNRSRSVGRSVVAKGLSTNLVMGQVKILKRGEKLSPDNTHRQRLSDSASAENRKARVKTEEDFDLLLGSTERLGPDPVTVQKQIRFSDRKDGIYAGSAFFTSPPPSCVPVPGFLAKNGAATSDLRRLLRLDVE